MIVSRRDKENHLDTIHYEIELLRYSYIWIVQQWSKAMPGERFVHLEAFLIHYRNLACFLAGRGRQAHLQFPHGDRWAGREITQAEIEMISQPALAIWEDYDTPISLSLAHCTVERADDHVEWNVSEMMRKIEPIIGQFLQLFPNKDLVAQFKVLPDGESYGTATVKSFGVFGLGDWRFK
jgi:hypothetical protein